MRLAGARFEHFGEGDALFALLDVVIIITIAAHAILDGTCDRPRAVLELRNEWRSCRCDGLEGARGAEYGALSADALSHSTLLSWMPAINDLSACTDPIRFPSTR